MEKTPNENTINIVEIPINCPVWLFDNITDGAKNFSPVISTKYIYKNSHVYNIESDSIVSYWDKYIIKFS
jgi:hypothetical protein